MACQRPRPMSERFHYRLSAPVVVITKGRGVETFTETADLFARLLEIVAVHRDFILSIRWGAKGAVTDDGIASLETMLALEGWDTFNRAGKRIGGKHARPFTRWEWPRVSDYLGWEWRAF
jgi:hypothetical protein